ncbi:MAG: hypothetical protein IJH12_10530 [Clostridia bacterium]|nr:hypothetical protein [Clostridia bacterium]
MKLRKNFTALALAVAMATAIVSQHASAMDISDTSSDIPDDAIICTYETTIYPDMVNFNLGTGGSVKSYYPAETFTFSGVRRGSDHVMDGNYMAYEVKIKMADGSTNSAVPVKIQVCKYSGSGIVSDWHTFYPDGVTHKVDWIPFTGGGTCYFKYSNTSTGTYSGPVTVTLTTYSWN